jgi:restriction system protein
MEHEINDHTAELVARWKQLSSDRTQGLSGVSAVGEVGNVVASAVGTAAGSASVHAVGATIPSGAMAFDGHTVGVEIAPTPRGLAVAVVLVDVGPKTDDGHIILAVRPAWRRILNEVTRDPKAFYQLTPRQFEEFNAGAYEEEGWKDVTLTPRSGDGERDIIAYRPDFGGLRVIVQVKLLKPGARVKATDVRAFSYVLNRDPAASKGVYTTSAAFAPGVEKEFASLIPTRLELRNGKVLQQWLARIYER